MPISIVTLIHYRTHLFHTHMSFVSFLIAGYLISTIFIRHFTTFCTTSSAEHLYPSIPVPISSFTIFTKSRNEKEIHGQRHQQYQFAHCGVSQSDRRQWRSPREPSWSIRTVAEFLDQWERWWYANQEKVQQQ